MARDLGIPADAFVAGDVTVIVGSTEPLVAAPDEAHEDAGAGVGLDPGAPRDGMVPQQLPQLEQQMAHAPAGSPARSPTWSPVQSRPQSPPAQTVDLISESTARIRVVLE